MTLVRNRAASGICGAAADNRLAIHCVLLPFA
jgi:hypothetical protein